MATWDDVYGRMQQGDGAAPKVWQQWAPGTGRSTGIRNDPMPERKQRRIAAGLPVNQGNRGVGQVPLTPGPTGGGWAPGGPAGEFLNEPFPREQGGGMVKPGMGMGGAMGGPSPQMLANALRGMMGGGTARPGMNAGATGGMAGASQGVIDGGWSGPHQANAGDLEMLRNTPRANTPSVDYSGLSGLFGQQPGGSQVTGGMNPADGAADWDMEGHTGIMPGRQMRVPQFSGFNQQLYPPATQGRANYGNAQPFFGFSQR